MTTTGNKNIMVNTDYWIGFGGNLGDSKKIISNALQKLNHHERISITAISPVYGSEPVGPKDQPDYINGVVGIKTDLSPNDLLEILKNIEKESGRIKARHWGERTLDLDILLHRSEELISESLTIPHPHIRERVFVLAPLADIAADAIIPGEPSLTVAKALKNCPHTKIWPCGKINLSHPQS